MVNISDLKFDARGLIPAIVIESGTNKVLMLAYMNAESLQISLDKGYTCFWSRSRQELWLKGDTSGNYQHIVSITADCDCDTLLIEVIKDGPACHTGSESCFFNNLSIGPNSPAFSFQSLLTELECSANNEEVSLSNIKAAADCLSDAASSNDKEQIISELSKMLYDSFKIMADNGITIEDIKNKTASL